MPWKGRLTIDAKQDRMLQWKTHCAASVRPSSFILWRRNHRPAGSVTTTMIPARQRKASRQMLNTLRSCSVSSLPNSTMKKRWQEVARVPLRKANIATMPPTEL